MRLTITAYHASVSGGFLSEQNHPIAIALQQSIQPTDLENITVKHNRVNATRQGYPVRFLIKGFNAQVYNNLINGIIPASSIQLEPRPVPMLEIISS